MTCAYYAEGSVDGSDMANLFDLTDVDVDFEFKVVEKLVRTGMGKLKLRV